MQKIRKQIVNRLFDKYIHQLQFKNYPKRSDKYTEQQIMLRGTTKPIFKTAQSAVVEKYVSLCKAQYVDKVMAWRKRYHNLRMRKNDVVFFKLSLHDFKSKV